MTNSRSMLTFLSLVAVTMAVLLVLDIYHLRNKNEKIAALLGAEERKSREEMLISSIMEIRNSSGNDIANFEKLAIDELDLVSIIESIEGAGRELKLNTKIASVEKTGQRGPSGEESVRITVSSEGAWEGNFSLMRAIESLPQRVSIERADFSRGEESWRSDITLNLYLFD